ncbi:MAG: malto-oligosyltrehalose trehalohydrolase [Acetobacteraceae bacterium]|nr:malto-oligosyltrehalose trehalohydrolase [Acetobacteraceae bacterium]
MNSRFAHEVTAGATILPDGTVRFRLWAPAQEQVSVAIEDGPVLPMRRSPDGWFETTAELAPGARYRYRLADGMLVPDPASRAQADDVHDPSVVVDPKAYEWRHPGWKGRPWHETVFYELHAGVFGGFRGVQAALPRLKALGITAVELMPVNDFPGWHNWGYDGVLPYAPDRAYGAPDELKMLVDAAHELGLMIFLDVVYNHFGPDGNYLSLYAPQFFREDHKTPWGPALDFRRPEVRAYFTNNVLMWLMEYRFDGLRFDAVHAIDDQSWVDEMAATVRANVEPGRHVHLVMEHHNDASHLHQGIDAQWNDDGHNVLHVLLTGESGGYYADYADDPADKLARVLAEGWAYQGEISHYLGGPRGSCSLDLPATAHVLFLQNHDQTGNRAFGERLTVLADPPALEAAIALLMLCPQIPLLFMGEETASRSPFLFFTDHNPELAQAVRDGRRGEFARFADFADPAKREQIPDPNAPQTFQGSIPHPDPHHATEREILYRTLIDLRMTRIAPFLDGARTLESAVIGPKAVMARWSLAGGAVLSLATNLEATPVRLDTPTGELLFASKDLPAGTLPGHCTAAYLETPHE